MKIALLFAGLAGVLAGVPETLAAPRSDAELPRYNVVWDSPSANAHDSMPIGNGDVGINAWVEPSGDLIFYISKTELAAKLKLKNTEIQEDQP